MATKIEWAEDVLNVMTGCTPISEGCKNCYAERQARWLQGLGQPKYVQGFTPTFHPEVLEKINPRQKPKLYFVNSMADTFHSDFKDSEIWQLLSAMVSCCNHRFMLLTKRPVRMTKWFDTAARDVRTSLWRPFWGWPLPNVALGVTIENQPRANERLPLLAQCPAAYRFVSIEPMLGPINLSEAWPKDGPEWWETGGGLDLVICGGESGPGARPMNPEWVRDLFNQCRSNGTPFCFKQWGEWAPNCLCHNSKPCRTVIRPQPGSRGCMFRCGKKRAGRELFVRGLGHQVYDGAIQWRPI
jgi:protein gp37